VGVSVHSWEFVAYADDLVRRCRELRIGLVFGGSVLTERDRADLLGRGVDAVFGPYAAEADMLQEIDRVVQRVRTGGAVTAAEPAVEPATAAPLAGRVVVVTGAAHGLGRAYTLELCRQGVAVVANDVDEAALEETVEAARATPGSAHPVIHDVTDPGASRLLLDAALRRYGQVHGLVANAGLLRSGPILRLSDDDLRVLLDVHVTAPFRLLRTLGAYWRGEAKAGRGIPAAAVLTTSAAGLYGFRGEAAYSAAKAAVAMLVKVAADELARYGTTVNAVAPAARTRLTPWLPDGPDDPWAPEHVAPVVAWLLGPDAREVTGRVIEAGNQQVSVPDGWRAGTAHPLPPDVSAAELDPLLRRVLAAATASSALLSNSVESLPGS
jgi:NAD(P)-dependent dehydrogenase (short-subunit alcohol dehydrogenase family)